MARTSRSIHRPHVLAVALLAASILNGCSPEPQVKRVAVAEMVAPSPQPISAYQLRLLVKSNQIIFVGTEDRLEPVCRCGPWVSIANISPFLRRAVVAAEDRRFYWHRGVDTIGVVRAVVVNAVNYIKHGGRGGRRQGGSTITQQLIKNLVLDYRDGLSRKPGEAISAYELEQVMANKAEILEAYLNKVVLGHDDGRPIVGVEQAARFYFGRTAAQLDLYESAVIAGMLKGPSIYNPLKHPKAARERADIVLQMMEEQGVISAAERTEALRKQRKRGAVAPMWVEARSYVEWALREVRRQAPWFRETSKSRIPIPLQVSVQYNAELALQNALNDNRFDDIEAAYLMVGKSGGIVSMIGQRDFLSSNFNFATLALRPPASSFKPLVFATALLGGSTSVDEHAIEKMAVSDNDFARDVFKGVGADAVVSYIRKLGIDRAMRTDPNLALGGSEFSLLDMVHAYRPFESGGLVQRPFSYFGILDDGRVLLWPQLNERRVLSPTQAGDMRRLLRAVVASPNGTGRAARSVKGAAGKTGTSDQYRDAWFLGMADGHTSGIWFGRADNTPMTSTINGAFAASIWAAIEAKALQD